MSQSNTCKWCGGNLIEGPGRGPHWKSLVCARCRHHHAWLVKPMAVQNPAHFVMPFGKFKGLSLDQIAHDPDGLRYLGWMAENVSSLNVRRHIQAFLQPRLASVPIQEPGAPDVDSEPDDDPRLKAVDPFWDEDSPPF